MKIQIALGQAMLSVPKDVKLVKPQGVDRRLGTPCRDIREVDEQVRNKTSKAQREP